MVGLRDGHALGTIGHGDELGLFLAREVVDEGLEDVDDSISVQRL